MDNQSPFEEHLKDYTRLFEAIHLGEYDSEESELIRDDLDQTYYKLTDEQHELINELCVVFVNLKDDLEITQRAFRKSLEEETSCTYDDRIEEAREEYMKEMGLL